MHYFTLWIDLIHPLLLAVLSPEHGVRGRMVIELRTIRGCCFIYKPWRSEPRICHTPPTKSSVQKGAVMLKEREKAEFLATEYEIIALRHGQNKAKNA